MRAKSLCAALVLAAAFSGLTANSAEACWWHHHGHHCHRCRNSSSSSVSASPSSGQSQQALISVDAGDLLITLLDRLGRRNVDGGDLGGSLGTKIDALSEKVDKLAGLVEKVEANTVEIDRVKVAQEAIAERVSNDYPTTKEVREIIATEVANKLGNAIDDKLNSPEFHANLGTQVKNSISDESFIATLAKSIAAASKEPAPLKEAPLEEAPLEEAPGEEAPGGSKAEGEKKGD